MKSKLIMCLFTLLTAGTLSVTAQVNNMSEQQRHQQMEQLKDRYEQQKKTIDHTHQNDLNALTAQTNLTPVQRNEQRRIINERFEQQKRANQQSFNAANRTLQSQHQMVKEDKKEMKEDQKEMKHSEKKFMKPMKPMKPMKH